MALPIDIDRCISISGIAHSCHCALGSIGDFLAGDGHLGCKITALFSEHICCSAVMGCQHWSAMLKPDSMVMLAA